MLSACAERFRRVALRVIPYPVSGYAAPKLWLSESAAPVRSSAVLPCNPELAYRPKTDAVGSILFAVKRIATSWLRRLLLPTRSSGRLAAAVLRASASDGR